MLNYQRVYPINIPLNHYKIPLNPIKSHNQRVVPRFFHTFRPPPWDPPKVHRGRELRKRSRKSTAGGAAPRLAGGNSPSPRVVSIVKKMVTWMIWLFGTSLVTMDWWWLMILNLWWLDDIELMVTMMEFGKKTQCLSEYHPHPWLDLDDGVAA